VTGHSTRLKSIQVLSGFMRRPRATSLTPGPSGAVSSGHSAGCWLFSSVADSSSSTFLCRGLDTSKGLTNEVLQFVDPATSSLRHTAWFRRLRGTGDVLYAGFYSVCSRAARSSPCVKVVFPLPNGNAIVIMRTECRPDGSFVVASAGDRFGEPGFYFTVHDHSGAVWARDVRALRESIHVYPAEDGSLRADHALTYFGATFLRLHYRMRRKQDFAKPDGAASGSQPIRPETNRTSSATWARR
jgi:hypothetical protein